MTIEEFKGVISGSIEFQDYSALNIRTHFVTLGGEVLAFVYRSRKDIFHVFISDSIPHRKKRQVFVHELHHIMNDLPKCGYILGINMQRTNIEMNADKLASGF